VAGRSIGERVRALVEPTLSAHGLEVLDVEQQGGLLRVTIDRDGGVDLEALSTATEIVSNALDRDDPIPGRYTLEVSSPGIERPLRTPEHFRRHVGSLVSVRTVPGVEGERRLQGVLESADEHGVVVGGRSLAYGDIDRARTVFEWPARAKAGARR
jgi:ribosome maturation factor RimP